VTPEERSARMSSMLIDASAFGHVTPLGPYQAQLVQPGDKVNHVLHLLLSVVTAGLWLVVWLLIASHSSPERRHILSIDENGQTWVDNEPRPRGLGR
jgi:hypothetical protein